MATRLVSLLYVIAFAAATFELRPMPLTPDYVTVSNPDARVLPPQISAVRMSASTTTPTDESFSIAVDLTATCANCIVNVVLYPATSASQVPRGYYAGGIQLRRTLNAPAGLPTRYNTSFPNGEGGAYGAWMPFQSADWSNGQYFLVVYIQDTATGLRSFYFAADLVALGVVSVTLSGSTSVPVWATVDYFRISPHTVNDGDTTAVTLSVHVAGDPAQRDNADVNVFCSKNSAFFTGAMSASGQLDGDGWFNVSSTLSSGAWGSSGAPMYIQPGARNCYVVTYPKTGNLAVITTSPTQLQARGFDATITLAGADFSTDVTPPHCNFTFPPTPFTDDTVVINGVCDEDLANSQVTVVPPAVTPPQRIGIYAAGVSQIGGGTFLPAANVGGQYRAYSIVVSDHSGNVAVYSSQTPPFFYDPIREAFSEGGDPQFANAYAAGEFSGPSAGTVTAPVYMLVLLVSLSLALVLLLVQ